jgi:nitrogen fixation NifU-like protein
LPSIKYHCSVLAVDALTEAVYDYYLKQGKNFPEGLVEQHKKLQQEKEVADKYEN